MNTITINHPTVQLAVNIPLHRIADLLIGAFEGGSGYWARRIKTSHKASQIEQERAALGFGDELFPGQPMYPTFSILPLIDKPGFYVDVIHDDPDGDEGVDFKTFRLDRAAIENGLKKFSELEQGKGGHHFPNFLAENDDEITADVFLQCCVLNSIVFG